MAISSGSGQHLAWVTIEGQTFPVDEGSVSRTATRKSGTFDCRIPLWWPNLETTLAALGSNTATVNVQTRGQTAALITGEIDMVDLDYVGGHAHVSGRDVSAKLHATKSAEKWVNKKPQDIIQDLAGRVGISTSIDAASVFAGRWVQIDWSKLTDSVSYASVIHKLCEYIGAHWFIDQNGTLQVKSTQSTSSPYVINYSRDPSSGEIVSDALGLTIRHNIQAGKTIKVTMNSWHERQKQAHVAISTINGKGGTTTYTYHIPGLTQDQVTAHASSKAADHARHEIELIAELVGDPTIQVSQQIQLNGTSFAQTLTIDSIDDKFGMSGHTMRICAHSAATGRTVSTTTGTPDAPDAIPNPAH